MKMTDGKLKVAWALSIIIAILAVAASVGGLFLGGLYRDNVFVKAAWRGNDWVTLAAAVPVLAASLALARRDSLRAQLVWMGMLDYMLYNFAFYLFGAAFNWFFLLYVALFTLSIFALIYGLLGMDAEAIHQNFHNRTPVKWISGYMLLIAAGLSGVYILQSLSFILTGQLPDIVAATGHPTNVVFALDFSLLIVWLVLGAVWLWQRRPWGYVIAAVSLIKGASYTLVLSASSLVALRAGVAGAAAELPLWGTLTLTSLIAILFLLGNLQSARQPLGKVDAPIGVHS
jgi:hypothetical protein